MYSADAPWRFRSARFLAMLPHSRDRHKRLLRATWRSCSRRCFDEKHAFRQNIVASMIAMSLLAIVYVGLCYVAALQGNALTGIATEHLLSTLALRVLGPGAGFVVCIAVIFACLTTA